MKKVNEDLDWKDISHEIYRSYTFPAGLSIKIINPLRLHLSKSGGHRILDANDVAHYIPPKWIHISWETNDDVAFRF